MPTLNPLSSSTRKSDATDSPLSPLSRLVLPLHNAGNPGRTLNVTTPGSFANAHDIGGPMMFSSPDTPGMPAASTKTAWDFLPEGWSCVLSQGEDAGRTLSSLAQQVTGQPLGRGVTTAEFTTARGQTMRVDYPAGFTPITQLESARLGIVTPEMRRVAEREPHFDELSGGRGGEAIRDEIAAGRLVIPANINHLKHKLDPMCICLLYTSPSPRD